MVIRGKKTLKNDRRVQIIFLLKILYAAQEPQVCKPFPLDTKQHFVLADFVLHTMLNKLVIHIA